jgi:hypothetical protein
MRGAYQKFRQMSKNIDLTLRCFVLGMLSRLSDSNCWLGKSNARVWGREAVPYDAHVGIISVMGISRVQHEHGTCRAEMNQGVF